MVSVGREPAKHQFRLRALGVSLAAAVGLSVLFVGLNSGTGGASEYHPGTVVNASDEVTAAIASYRDIIEEIRIQEWTTDLHLEILSDYWISDEELATVETAYVQCVAMHFPGAVVTFPNPFMSEIEFASEEQAEINRSEGPCHGVLGVIRPLHYQMRVNPLHHSQQFFIRQCFEDRGLDIGTNLTDSELSDLIWSDEFITENPEGWQCVVEVTALPIP